MSGLAFRAGNISKTSRQRAVRPVLEGLEDRLLLYSVTGDHFTYGSRITWSIMPDGTSLGGIPSNLGSSMDSKTGAGNWETAIEDAFAQWENITNVNFAQVPDDGAAWGSGPDQQGSPEYGDIRIGGLALGSNVLAFTMYPPSANGGSDAGDLFFNTSQPWSISGSVDLETVALHEIGHALGMGHSTNVAAVMYPYYGGVEQSLTTDDINGVRSIWGPRQEDPIEQLNGNTVSTKAPDLTSFITPSNGQAYLPGLDVANTGEAYWFKITTPAGSSNVFTAQVQSTGLSELSPRVQVYNAALQGLAQTSAPANSYGATINATITNATPNTTYYIKVLGSNAGATGTGGYALTINTGFQYIGNATPPNTTVLAQADQGGGNEMLTMGGTAGALKAWVLGGENINFGAPGIVNNPTMTAQLTTLANELVSTTSQPTVAFENLLIGALQEIPNGVLEDVFYSTGGNEPDPISASQLDAILGRFFAAIQPPPSSSS